MELGWRLLCSPPATRPTRWGGDADPREEVAAGLLGPEDYSVLPTYFRRTARYLKLALTGRWGEWFRERRLHAAAVDLALAKRVSRSGMRGEDERVDRLRQKLLGLRGELPSPGAGGTRWTPPA